MITDVGVVYAPTVVDGKRRRYYMEGARWDDTPLIAAYVEARVWVETGQDAARVAV